MTSCISKLINLNLLSIICKIIALIFETETENKALTAAFRMFSAENDSKCGFLRLRKKTRSETECVPQHLSIRTLWNAFPSARNTFTSVSSWERSETHLAPRHFASFHKITAVKRCLCEKKSCRTHSFRKKRVSQCVSIIFFTHGRPINMNKDEKL